jgi:cob(I)alamin adenosyltransferase
VSTSGKGLVIVYTGQGKGKTTAALGLVLRALGRDMPVAVMQFIKGKWPTGERAFAEHLPGLEFRVMGRGFTWESDDISQDRAMARAAWAEARAMISGGAYPVVILDELTYCMRYGFVDVADVIACLHARPDHVHVVITGRHAPDELVEAADLVTEMRNIKHPFERGLRAQKGIDF